jgi:diaminohydroxyphosphoribosylaminopyrimidine deaminase/5-amino-6-(5-phosphoribosylamino)uracil reductase
MQMNDAGFMAEAVELSRLGFPAPNPRVGAVVVKNGAIIGKGYHAVAGLPHAEINALVEASGNAIGADLFVTLEPCDHHGKTPPCTEAIIAAGIRRVVFANPDPNPAASGGSARLEGNGITVEHGLLAKEAAEVNRVFEGRWRLGRPYVLVKAAATLDGRIADKAGVSKWISDEIARKRAHELRAELGCVLIGAETALRDNPSLTCRDVDGVVHLRVVLDPHRRLPDDLIVFTTDDARTVRVVAENPAEADVVAPMTGSSLELAFVLDEIAKHGMIGVLVEGGGHTIGEFFNQGLVDEVELHVAPRALGGGISWLESPRSLQDAWQLTELAASPLGNGIVLRAKVKN